MRKLWICHLLPQNVTFQWMCHLQHSNINLANHQGIMEELWIHELDGFRLHYPRGVWKWRVDGGVQDWRVDGLLFAKEVRNWEFVKQKSHSEWSAAKMRFPNCMLAQHFFCFFLSVLSSKMSSKTHTWTFSRKVEEFQLFIPHVMVWPMIQWLAGLVLDHVKAYPWWHSLFNKGFLGLVH